MADEKTPQQAGTDAVNARLKEVYYDMAATIESVVHTKKAQEMTGPEALRHIARLLRETGDNLDGQ